MNLKARKNRYSISETRKSEFDQRPNEDVYQWIARQLDQATPFEATWLMLLRKDERQLRAYEILQLAKTNQSNRRVVRLMAVGLILSAASMATAILNLISTS